MKDNKYLKTLVSDYASMEEYNDDEDTENPIDDPEVESDCVDLLEHIGKEEFKNIYLNVIFNLKQQPLEKQITLCNNILLKIEQVHDFTFMRKLHIASRSDISKVYKLIEFIEFNNLRLLVELLYGLIEDVRNINVRKFYEDNWTTIQNRLQSIMTSELVTEFVRTNNKENLISFLSNTTEKKRIEITGSLLLKKRNENQ